jgi:pilus assembly protein Flp/PilA
MMHFRELLSDQEGATAIEYGLIAALVATGAIVAMGALGNSLSNTFTQVSTKMQNAQDGKGPF